MGISPTSFSARNSFGYEIRRFCRITNEEPPLHLHQRDQANAEATALFEFLRLADRVGLEIPLDHKWLREWKPFRNIVGNRSAIGIAEWPHPDLYEALALAQHHGVPTRLLDFTYDPLIAAFFAAVSPPSAATRIAVWCVDLEPIDLAAIDARRPFGIVTVPKLRNRNLAARKGSFLLDRRTGSGGCTPLEDRLDDHIRSGENRGTLRKESEAVKRFSLPSSVCSRLLAILNRLDIDRAHLMPLFDGVVRELEVRRSRNMTCEIHRVGVE